MATQGSTCEATIRVNDTGGKVSKSGDAGKGNTGTKGVKIKPFTTCVLSRTEGLV
jgi:hypothetical protein